MKKLIGLGIVLASLLYCQCVSAVIAYRFIYPVLGDGQKILENIKDSRKYGWYDSGNSDYRLQPCSPCINAGTSNGAPASDLDKVNRPQASGYDIGAYEYMGAECENADVHPSAAEVCDGIDNDGDERVDEGFDVGALCATGTGACEVIGYKACSEDGTTTICHATARTPSEEICNGIDDNCNGQVDENLTQSCGSDVGECRSGTQVCSKGSWGSCENETVAATEICDRLDNDCDGETDERFDSDSDGIANCVDNCPDAANAGQEDSDSNGIGDACEPEPDNVIYVGSGRTYTTIQAAINASSNGDILIVDDGTYVENIILSNKAITIRSMNGAAKTIIDGNKSGSVAAINSTFPKNANQVVLDGFTIRNGSSGGIFCQAYSSPTITSCIISSNSTSRHGGGIYCNIRSSPKIVNCIISGNSANRDGGGIFCYDMFSSPKITNCVISGNSAGRWGGGICCPFSPSLTKVTNSIIWGNSSQVYSGSPLTLTYCDVENGFAGTGNINKNPLFVDASSGNYHLQLASPCIGTGQGGQNMGIDF